jgi:hypothetical protein
MDSTPEGDPAASDPAEDVTGASEHETAWVFVRDEILVREVRRDLFNGPLAPR